jgi:putative membrane protein
MNTSETNTGKKPAGPADYLANERTFLAWIRTSIALMGFGFVIVKFAVFLRQAAFMTNRQLILPENRTSAVTGIVMVILGALVAVLAYVRYRHIEKQLNQNDYFPSKWLSVLVTAVIVIGSILLILYLGPSLY